MIHLEFFFFHLKSFFLIDYGFCGYEHCLSSKLRYCINNVLSSNLHVYHNNFFLYWCKIHLEKKYLLTHFCLFFNCFCLYIFCVAFHSCEIRETTLPHINDFITSVKREFEVMKKVFFPPLILAQIF